MASAKIVIIGGGICSWGPTIERDILVTEDLRDGKIVLHDIDSDPLTLIYIFIFSVVLECSGNPKATKTAFRLVGRRGRVVLLGSTRGVVGGVDFYEDVHQKGLIIIGAHNTIRPKQDSTLGYWTWRDDAVLMLQLLKSGKLMWTALSPTVYLMRR